MRVMKQDKWLEDKLTVLLAGHITWQKFWDDLEVEEST